MNGGGYPPAYPYYQGPPAGYVQPAVGATSNGPTAAGPPHQGLFQVAVQPPAPQQPYDQHHLQYHTAPHMVTAQPLAEVRMLWPVQQYQEQQLNLQHPGSAYPSGSMPVQQVPQGQMPLDLLAYLQANPPCAQPVLQPLANGHASQQQQQQQQQHAQAAPRTPSTVRSAAAAPAVAQQLEHEETVAAAEAAAAAAAGPGTSFNLRRMNHKQLLAAAADHNQRAIGTTNPIADTLRGIDGVARLRPGTQPATSFSLATVGPESPYAKAWKSIRRSLKAATAAAAAAGVGTSVLRFQSAAAAVGKSSTRGANPGGSGDAVGAQQAAGAAAAAGGSGNGPSMQPRGTQAAAKLTPEQQRWVDKLSAYLGRPVKVPPLGPGLPALDLRALWLEVMALGGSRAAAEAGAWPDLADKLQHDAGLAPQLALLYDCYLEPLESGLPLGVRPARALDVIEGRVQQRAAMGARVGSHAGVRHAARLAEAAFKALNLQPEQQQQQPVQPAGAAPATDSEPAAVAAAGPAALAPVTVAAMAIEQQEGSGTGTVSTAPTGDSTAATQQHVVAVGDLGDPAGVVATAAAAAAVPRSPLPHQVVGVALSLLHESALFPAEVVGSIRGWGLKPQLCPERFEACKKALRTASRVRKRAEAGRRSRASQQDGSGADGDAGAVSSSSEDDLSDLQSEEGQDGVQTAMRAAAAARHSASDAAPEQEQLPHDSSKQQQQQPEEETMVIDGQQDGAQQQQQQQQQRFISGPPGHSPAGLQPSGLSDSEDDEDDVEVVDLLGSDDADESSQQVSPAQQEQQQQQQHPDQPEQLGEHTAAAGNKRPYSELSDSPEQLATEDGDGDDAQAAKQVCQEQRLPQQLPHQQASYVAGAHPARAAGVHDAAAPAAPLPAVEQHEQPASQPRNSSVGLPAVLGTGAPADAAAAAAAAAAALSGVGQAGRRSRRTAAAAAASSLSQQLAQLPREVLTWQAARWLLLTCRALRAGPPGCNKAPVVLSSSRAAAAGAVSSESAGQVAKLRRLPLFGEIEPRQGAKRVFKGITPKCMACTACLNPQMKKACLTNRQRLAEGLPPIVPKS